MTVDSNFLLAERNFDKGQAILELGTKPTTEGDTRRIQVSGTKYILPPAMIYHSCDPNAYIKWEDMSLRARKNILKDELVTYHYGTSEYDYSVGAFACKCGSTNCIEYFSGFKEMTFEQQQSISDYISNYIKNLWKL